MTEEERLFRRDAALRILCAMIADPSRPTAESALVGPSIAVADELMRQLGPSPARNPGGAQ